MKDRPHLANGSRGLRRWSSRPINFLEDREGSDGDDHYLIRPTIDRTFVPGEFSTVSDHKDNVHWFTAQSDDAFLFNVRVIGINLANTNVSGRVYVDPMGEKVGGGLIKAPKITHAEATRLYG